MGPLEPPVVWDSLAVWERFERSLPRDPLDLQAKYLRRRALDVIARKKAGLPVAAPITSWKYMDDETKTDATKTDATKTDATKTDATKTDATKTNATETAKP